MGALADFSEEFGFSSKGDGRFIVGRKGDPTWAECVMVQDLILPNHNFLSLSHIKWFEGVSSSTLAWRIPWTEEPGGLHSMGLLRVGHDWATSLSLFTFMHWRRKWRPTPVFLPENPKDGGAWWAAVYGVAQSRTRLKWLSSSSSSTLPKLGQIRISLGMCVSLLLNSCPLFPCSC